MDRLEEVTLEREKAIDERDDSVAMTKKLLCERDDLRWEIVKLKEKIRRYETGLVEIKDLPEETARINQYIDIAIKVLEGKPKEESATGETKSK